MGKSSNISLPDVPCLVVSSKIYLENYSNLKLPFRTMHFVLCSLNNYCKWSWPLLTLLSMLKKTFFLYLTPLKIVVNLPSATNALGWTLGVVHTWHQIIFNWWLHVTFCTLFLTWGYPSCYITRFFVIDGLEMPISPQKMW